jgi:hypothetical protein
MGCRRNCGHDRGLFILGWHLCQQVRAMWGRISFAVIVAVAAGILIFAISIATHRLSGEVDLIQLASFTLFASLGSVQRTARGHPNASTVKNNDKETGKLANGEIRSKADRLQPRRLHQPRQSKHRRSKSTLVLPLLAPPNTCTCPLAAHKE